jgi:hypothetical protein
MRGRTGELKRMVKDAIDLNVKITALEKKRNFESQQRKKCYDESLGMASL